MSELERAIAYAVAAHDGQADKLGEPYILHPLRVMFDVPPRARRVAVLHDVVEDTGLTVAQVTNDLGLSPVEEAALRLLTRDRSAYSYHDRIELIATASGPPGTLARRVKASDLRDNLQRWTPELGEDLKRRYERAMEQLYIAPSSV